MRRMQHATLLVVGMFLWAVPSGAWADTAILKFETMVGVSGAFVGPTNPIRGVPGGGVPWAIAEGRGELRTDGRLEIQVRGLVLAAGPNAGTNPVTDFRAIVSCLTPVGAGTVNVSTGNFPATATGDADIEAMVVLPSPCVAPIIFVTNPAGRWFSATGF